uniref:Uncharacterized protein n=1 Tax=Arundo donax TaxID=35708 RepID=A0A0A9BLT8_ARUDO
MIEVDNVVREFVAGEDMGPELGVLAAVLDILASQLADDVEFVDSDCWVDANVVAGD